LPHHAGKDDSTTVPEDMGKLEMIICCLHESDSGSDSLYDCMSGKDDSKDDGGRAARKDNSKDDGKDNSEDDEPEDSDDPDYGGRAVHRGVKRSKGTMHNSTTTESTEFKNAKPLDPLWSNGKYNALQRIQERIAKNGKRSPNREVASLRVISCCLFMLVSVLKHLEIHIVFSIINIHMIQLFFNLIHLLILQLIYFFLLLLPLPPPPPKQ
jgi:hypothetical protein